MTETSTNIDGEPSEPPTRHETVTRLRRALEHADPGTLAALRRAEPETPPSAFYRVAIGLLDEHRVHARRRDDADTRWCVVARALAQGLDFVDDRVALGKALALAGVSEMRVLRLLDARRDQLHDLARQVVHQLVQKGQRWSAHDLADLVLAADDDHGPRRAIARAFYRNTDV